MKPWILGLAALAMLPHAAFSAEPRVWMSRQGGTIEASLTSINGDQVVLHTAEAREVRLRVSDLSLGDRQHLVEFGGADRSIITEGSPGTPETDVRLDTSTFNRLPDKLTFPDQTAATFDLFETPHFLIATAGGVRPQSFAETAERLWHGMAFQHMNFRLDWGDQKVLIIAVEDRAVHEALGKWFQGHLARLNQQESAQRVGVTWNQTGSTSISLPDEMTSQYNLQSRALVFNVTDSSRYRRAMSPFAIHTMSGFLLTNQLGGVSSYGSEGYFAITTGHAYFKEISLGGKSETNILDVSGTDDEISSHSGFQDGSSWARTLRQMVRRNRVEMNLEDLLRWSSSDLTPERLVMIYSFAYYMQSDSRRLSSFAAMVRRIESSNQIPEPIEIARLFGFESVEELETDWTTFVREGAFR